MRGKRGWAIWFIGKISLQQTLVTMAMAIALATALMGLQGLRAALITLVLIWGLGWALKRTLGGQTGDTLGAAIELGELLFLLAAAVRPDANGEGNRMETVSALLAAIPQPDVAGMARAQQHIDGLLKAARQSWPSGDAGGTAGRSAWFAGAAGAGGESDCGHVRRPWRLA
ncbi:cobalamin synthase [Klebsiella pneumoniae subsp. ozaenae]|uniref:Adenosylcobinamide-GDP ribazoletransferase n=1 Tax=Klebsiella pneumoniae subsp. ozaenae TaxID=574 RepID=A0A378BIK6_KLEPO|nr:cobalamin synthase [Klebsiella pneumoniae subsp. ozaenae]